MVWAYQRELPRIVREQRWTLLAVFLVYVVAIAAGYHAAQGADLEQAFRFFERMTAPDWYDRVLPAAPEGFSGHSWLHFFTRNTLACLISFLSGAATLGLVALGIISRSGYEAGWTIGFWSGFARQASGGGPVATGAAILLPHGLLEYPALVLAWALALRAGVAWIRPLPNLRRWPSVKRLFRDFCLSLLVVIPLLLGAALLEAYAHPALAYRYLLGIGRYERMVSERVVGRPFGGVYQSAWSPGGERLATVDQSETRVCVETTSEDSASVLLAEAGERALLSSPSWSPDGKRIALIRRPTDRDRIEENKLVVLDVASRKLSIVARGPVGRYLRAAWAPDADRIACIVLEFSADHTRTMGTNIWEVDVRSGTWHKITSFEPGGRGVAPGNGLSWRPDGRAIAFVKSVPQQGQEGARTITSDRYVLCVAASDGARVKEVTRMKHTTDVAWSPDGNWIAFSDLASDVGTRASLHSDGWEELDLEELDMLDIGLVRPEGSDRTDGLARIDAYSSLSWSPDGKRLAYQRLGTCIIGTPGILASQ